MNGKKYSGKFCLGWLRKAACLPGKSLHVALAVLLAERMEPMGAPQLTNKHVAQFGVNRNGKYRALAWLEKAGLVSVERKLGKSPQVRILDDWGGTVGE